VLNKVYQMPGGGFFSPSRLGRLSARPLAAGRPQTLLCVLHQRATSPPLDASGLSAVSIDVVHFPASDLKRQQDRLRSFVGKSAGPDLNKARIRNMAQDFFDGKPVPNNGCRKG
jgi:hypothetical protein